MKAIRLIHSQVTDRVGEMPSLVSMRPCTIHGWRPLSVRNQPAVFITNGSTAAHTATRRNTGEVASFFRYVSHSPHAPMSRTSTPP